MYSICMKGNIYTDQRCPICDGTMRHDEREGNCVCSKCNIGATGKYIVKFGRSIKRRFKTYKEAARFLTGLRFKEDEGTLDARDYQKGNPFGLEKQAEKWLAVIEKEVGSETLRKYKRFMRYACESWGPDRNVKTIRFGDIQDFLVLEERFNSSKYRYDARSCINIFFDWLVDRENIIKPKLPNLTFELGWRNIVDLETQQRIIEETYKIATQEKIPFGIELLATYTNLRPDDLRRIEEKDYQNGVIRFERPTKRKNKGKIVHLLEEHKETWERLKAQHPAMPHMPFFRHHNQSGVESDSLYGKDLLYNWWKKACENIGIEEIDLYGGTRHSTTSAIAEMTDEATAQSASEHGTNKAFRRYCQAQNHAATKAANMVNARRKMGGTPVVHIKTKKEPAN